MYSHIHEVQIHHLIPDTMHSDVMDDSKIFLEDVKVTDWILIFI